MGKSFAPPRQSDWRKRGRIVGRLLGWVSTLSLCVCVGWPLCALTLQLAAVLSAANIYSGH